MKLSRMPAWPFGVASAFAALLAAWFWVVAASTASLRFGHCGPATADATDEYCQVAAKVLYQSYWAAALAIVLAVVAIWVKVRRHEHGVGA
jgi:hypothetical protein